MDAFHASLFGGYVSQKNATGGNSGYKGITRDSAEYKAIQTNLMDVANSLASCAPVDTRMLQDFFGNLDNWRGILDAKDKLGLPPKNRPSYKNGGLFGRWNDFCDTEAPVKFYNLAKKQVAIRAVEDIYPVLSETDKDNCYKLKSALVLIDKDRANSIDDVDMKEALEAKISEYNGLYSKLTCDKYIIDKEKEAADNATKEKEKNAQQSQQQAFDRVVNPTVPTAPPKEPTSVGTYVVYGFAGLAGVLFLYAITSKLSKSSS